MADEPRLSKRAELLLASFPVPERDWEDQARAVEARLSTVTRGSTEERWLAAPLPETAEERGAAGAEDAHGAAPSGLKADAKIASTDTPFPFAAMSSLIEAAPSEPRAEPPAATAGTPGGSQSTTTSSEPATQAATVTPLPSSGSSQSLSALARSVAQKAGRAQAPRDIARESLSVAAAARSHSDAIVERVRGARPAPPPPPSQRPARASAPVPTTPSQGNQQLGPWIAIGGLGIAAAVALWVFARPQAPNAAQISAPAEPAAVAKRAPAQAVEAAPVAQAAPKLDQDSSALAKADSPTPALAASSLPLAPRAPALTGLASRRALEPAAAPGGAGTPTPVGAAAARPAPESVVLEDTATPAKVAGASKAGAAPTASGLRPAAGSPSGGLPDRPSTGAVQAAVGSVMGPARACVAGGVATPAQVTFGSDGTVQSVTVSGPNAGTAAASCIDGALRRARVAPFTSPSFSLMVWVRP